MKMNNFVLPLEDDACMSSSPILSIESVSAIFSNVGMLLGLHQQLLSKLEAGRDSNRLSNFLKTNYFYLRF